jgi:small subunit ribosomal protein S1
MLKATSSTQKVSISETQEWKPGFDAQREEWERQYAVAQERFLAHKKQKAEAKAAEAAAEDTAVLAAE